MAGPGGETLESGTAPFTVVYAFAGPSRHCDMRSCLEQLIPGVNVLEFDICRDDKHDLTQDSVWEKIFRLVTKPRTVFFTSPPCNTHSRARRRKPGPQPLRSSVWPRGFPWLAPAKAAAVEDANFILITASKPPFLQPRLATPSCGSIQKTWALPRMVSFPLQSGTCQSS